MKTLLNSIFLVFAILIGSATNSQASRGDLISYEELAYFDHQDVVDFFTSQFDNYINPEDNPEFFELATAYFNSLIDQRNITVYKLIYETIDFNDEVAEASGIILIPDHEQYDCSKSFSLYAHGTVFARDGVNSRPANWGGEFMLTLMMASINTICVAPDYFGLGDGDGFHHHSHYKTNANSSLDCIRAGRNLCDLVGVRYNNRLMPMGYSEGGHASMALSRMVRLEGLEDEFAIRFIGAGSGAYDMSGEAFNFIVGNPYYPTRQYILYQVASCQDMYQNLILEEEGETASDYLKSPYDELYTEHVLGQTGNLSWVPNPWPQMFQPGVIEEMLVDPQHPFRQCLAGSNVFDWYNTTPTLMYYCTSDEQVPYTGALKTRDVQRALIPWWLFWKRFKIQAVNLTLDNTIPDHATCALPSIFVQLAVMSLNLGLDCEFTGRMIESADMLRTAGGESVGGKTIYSSKAIDFRSMNHRGDVRSVYGINFQTGTEYQLNRGTSVQIEENGFYVFRIQHTDDTESVTWLYKAEPDFVNTDDYDPLSNNPMLDRSILDLSLLEEDVRQVAIVDEYGSEHLVVDGNLNTSIMLNRQPSMSAGDYIVEVRTARNTYPLKLKVTDENSMSDLMVYPNPAMHSIRIDLKNCIDATFTARIMDVKGAEVKSIQGHAENCSADIVVRELDPGMYTVSIFSGTSEEHYEFVKQ